MKGHTNMGEEINPQLGDTIKVELNDGNEFTGTFSIHPLAGECVLNQHGFPMNYKKIKEIL